MYDMNLQGVVAMTQDGGRLMLHPCKSEEEGLRFIRWVSTVMGEESTGPILAERFF